MIMLTRSSERIFNPMCYAGIVIRESKYRLLFHLHDNEGLLKNIHEDPQEFAYFIFL